MLRQVGRSVRSELEHPVPTALWAAGFSFSSSSLLLEVPYDPLLTDLFFGEEISMAARYVPYKLYYHY